MGDAPSIGPLTDALWQGEEDGPPAICREWHRKVKHTGDYMLLWGGATRRPDDVLSWLWMHTALSDEEDEEDKVRTTPGTSVERMLSPLAHEGRIRIMQALLGGPLSAGALSEATGFRGGGLYHHLRELRYAAYVRDAEDGYALTPLGHQLLLTVACIARKVIVDEGERGLAVAADWGPPQ